MASAEAVLKYRTEGQAEALRGARDVAQASAQLAERSARQAQVQAVLEAQQRRLAQAFKLSEAEISAYNAATAQAANANEAVVVSLDKVAEAQAGTARVTEQAAKQSTQAANDNAAAFGLLGEAAQAALKIAAENPVATVTALAGGAKGLSGFADYAASALGRASDATRRFAEENRQAGTSAGFVATGLDRAADAAAGAANVFGALSLRLAPGAAGANMIVGALTRIAPLIGPIGLVAAGVAAISLAVGKANADLDKLVTLGERAEKLDLAAPFVKSFEGVGARFGLEVDQVAAALEKASGLLSEKYGQGNPLAKTFGDLDAAGDSGLSDRVRLQAELAQTTGQRLQVALDAMRELEASGKRLALLDLADKLLGPEFAERLRTGQITIRGFVDDLDAARGKELLKQEDVARAVALQREIGQVKREIGEAWQVTMDFSSAATLVDRAWLKVLKPVRDVLESFNKSTGPRDRAEDIARLTQEVAGYEKALASAVSQGNLEAVSQSQDALEISRDRLADLKREAEDAKSKLDISPPLRTSSEAVNQLAADADRARATVPGLGVALDLVAGSAANAAAKIGSVADGIRALQNLNPDLSGALGYLDKVGGAQSIFDATRGRIEADFQKSGDEVAKAKALTQATDEYKRSLQALDEQRRKPVSDIVREGDLSKLNDLDRSVAQLGDRMSEARRKVQEDTRLLISKAASPQDAEKLQQDADREIARINTAQKLLETKARTDAAAKAASGASSGSDAYDNALARTRDETEELELQAKTLGRVGFELHKLTEANRLWRAARKAGRDEQKGIADEIDREADAYARMKTANEAATEQYQRMRESLRALGDDFSRFFDDVLFGAGKLEDAFTGMARGLASSGLQGLLTGQGPLAGMLGTASPVKGEMGGLLGGINPFARSFERAVEKGAESGTAAGAAAGTSSGLLDAFTGVDGKQLMQGAAGLALIGGGFMASQKQGGLMGAASGGISGAIGGYMLGNMLMPGVGGIVGAVGGGLIGAAGSLFGKSDAEKQKEAEERQRKEAAKAAYEQNQRNIELLQRTFRGQATGGVEQQIEDARQKARDAAKVAREANHQGHAERIERDLEVYIGRVRAQFAREFTGMLADIEAGLGVDGPFARASAAVKQVGESLKSFVADAEEAAKRARGNDPAKGMTGGGIALPPALAGMLDKLGGALGDKLQGLLGGGGATASPADRAAAEDRVRRARQSAQQAALGQLDAPEQLSAVAMRMREIAGTGAGLRQVLVDLGMSADQAARAIRDRTKAAIDALRESFDRDIGRKLNDATGKSYLNDAADLMKEIATARADAALVGGNRQQVEDYFTAAAQKIVDESQLTGAAFDDLVRRFPELKGRVREFAEVLDAAAQAAAIAARKLAYGDRLFAAGNDVSTLEGQLAAYDRQAARERVDEVKAGGQALADLEAAQYAERLKIVRDFNEAAAASDRQRADEARTYLTGALKNVTQYLVDLKVGPQSNLSPADRLGAAQAQFSGQLTPARGGDRDALSGITSTADALLDAARAQYASGEGFQAVYAQIVDALSALPKQVSSEQFIVDAIGKAANDNALGQQGLLAAIQSNSPSLIASALTANFDRLDTSDDRLLSTAEFLAGLGPLATSAEQAAARAIFQSIDLDGDGQISRLELLRNELKAAIGANNPTAIAAALNANFAALDTTMNGRLSKAEFLVGVGPLATKADQDAALAVFKSIDGDGDGQITKLELLRVELKAAVAAGPAATATALNANFTTLDTSVNGLLDFNELKAGLGPLATADAQAAALAVFRSIDLDGDGQISRLEAMKASLGGTFQTNLVAAVKANNATAVATALNANFANLTRATSGLLNLSQFKLAIGPLATKAEQDASEAIFRSIDLDGDGQISRLEAMKVSLGANFQTSLLAAVKANSPAAISDALKAHFDTLDTNVNGLLDKTELAAALAGLATAADQERARLLLNDIDTNGDGAIDKMELVRAQTEATKTAVNDNTVVAGAMKELLAGINAYTLATRDNASATRASVESGNKYTDQIRANSIVANRTLAAINDLSGIQRDQLIALNNQFSLNATLTLNGRKLNNNMVTALNKITFNTALTDNARNNAEGVYAEGGYTGPGSKYQRAGSVHRGEIVWSQDNIARAGGVAAVEAMRLGLDDRSNVVPFPVSTPVATPMVGAGGGFDIGAMVAELRALRAEVKAQGETLARLTKNGFDRSVQSSDGVRDEVAGRREDAKRAERTGVIAGRGKAA